MQAGLAARRLLLRRALDEVILVTLIEVFPVSLPVIP